MSEIVVLGGYGRLGRVIVRELVAQTRAPIAIAGPNVQRAESLALSYPERARGVYASASDPRTLVRVLDGARAVIACCGGDLLPALNVALERRIAFLAASAFELESRHRRLIGEVSWNAQTPVVLFAGAVPGLPGIAAEWLQRKAPDAAHLQIASTGPWRGSERAEYEAAARPTPPKRTWLPTTIGLGPENIPRRVVAHSTADLDGFTERNTASRIDYFEPPAGRVARQLDRVLGTEQALGFALTGLAFPAVAKRATQPLARIDIRAADPLAPAAAVLLTLIHAHLATTLPAGLSTAHEAVNPNQLVGDLEKLGVEVTLRS